MKLETHYYYNYFRPKNGWFPLAVSFYGQSNDNMSSAKSPKKRKTINLFGYLNMVFKHSILCSLQLNGRRPRIEQVQDLLVHLTLGPVWRLQVFLKVLTLTGNNHLLHHLGLNEDEYADSPMPKR